MIGRTKEDAAKLAVLLKNLDDTGPDPYGDPHVDHAEYAEYYEKLADAYKDLFRFYEAENVKLRALLAGGQDAEA